MVDLDLESLFLKCQADLPQILGLQDSTDFASNLLLNAARKGLPFSQYYVGRCFEQGNALCHATELNAACGCAFCGAATNSNLVSAQLLQQAFGYKKLASLPYLSSVQNILLRIPQQLLLSDLPASTYCPLHQIILTGRCKHRMQSYVCTVKACTNFVDTNVSVQARV